MTVKVNLGLFLFLGFPWNLTEWKKEKRPQNWVPKLWPVLIQSFPFIFWPGYSPKHKCCYSSCTWHFSIGFLFHTNKQKAKKPKNFSFNQRLKLSLIICIENKIEIELCEPDNTDFCSITVRNAMLRNETLLLPAHSSGKGTTGQQQDVAEGAGRVELLTWAALPSPFPLK